MRTDFRSAIRAGNSIYSAKLSMLTDLTLLCMTINPKNLESLLVPVPNMTIQNSKAEKYNELLSTLAAYSYEMKKIEQKINEFNLEGEE